MGATTFLPPRTFQNRGFLDPEPGREFPLKYPFPHSAKTRLCEVAKRTKLTQFGFDNLAEYSDWRRLAGRAIRRGMNRSDLFVMFVGNHLGVLPMLDEFARKPGRKASLICDAHIDMYEYRSNREEINHGNFLRHAPESIDFFVLGDREMAIDPGPRIVRRWSAFEVGERGFPACWKDIRSVLGSYDQVHIDFDFDSLEQSVFPATSTPVPFGLQSRDLGMILRYLPTPQCRTISFCEYLPQSDIGGLSAGVVAGTLELLLNQLRLFAEDPKG